MAGLNIAESLKKCSTGYFSTPKEVEVIISAKMAIVFFMSLFAL